MHLLTPRTLLPILLALTSTPFTIASPSASSPENHLLQNLSSPDTHALEDRQIAAGGGIAPTTLAASQYPISTTVGSLYTVDGVTSATWKLFVQTFATTALGTWDLGPTPGIGVIGLGDIVGTVGGVRKEEKRAVETPGPVV